MSDAAEIAARVLDAYEDYQARFGEITRRSPRRFRERHWRGARVDASERLLLYDRCLDRLLRELAESRGEGAAAPRSWRAAKEAYAGRVGGRADAELALTFFNSASRRALDTVGVNEDAEFVGDDLPRPASASGDPGLRRHPVARAPSAAGREGSEASAGSGPSADPALERAVRRLLEDLPLSDAFADLPGDARRVAGELADRVAAGEGSRDPVEGLDVLPSLFYRNKGAYVVGRLRTRSGTRPLVLPLLSRPEGVVVDAVLVSSDETSVVFGFSRSYFHVAMDRPRELVAFLRDLMPRKRVDELYSSLGYDRHGKTELYRTLRHHLDGSSGRFEFAEGETGLVMCVFTLPGLDVVFKVIRDRFPPQKRVTAEDVKERYRMVYIRDRVGRLADAQEFEHLEIHRDRFSSELLERLLEVAPGTVAVEGEQLVVEHLYAVRQMTPLNLYLERAAEAEARSAILDYGQAIKDLAAVDIFPGDLLLKNFGVSRHGRVIFYDYDELTQVTDCRFRALPTARRPEDALADEPWYYVAPNDHFPEEFPRFLAIPDDLREPFMERHGDLFEPDFWWEMQARLRDGEEADFFPYPRERRLGSGDQAGSSRSSFSKAAAGSGFAK